MVNKRLICDPGAHGAFAIFEKSVLQCFYKTAHWLELQHVIADATATGLIEKNHGIQGQAAGSTYAQGFNAGCAHRVLESICDEVHEVAAQTWMREFGVPRGMETKDRKRWIQAAAVKIVGKPIPLWAADAVALGLTYDMIVADR